jgi:hypothetical protein
MMRFMRFPGESFMRWLVLHDHDWARVATRCSEGSKRSSWYRNGAEHVDLKHD